MSERKPKLKIPIEKVEPNERPFGVAVELEHDQLSMMSMVSDVSERKPKFDIPVEKVRPDERPFGVALDTSMNRTLS